MEQESSSELPTSPLPKLRSRRKIGHLPMTTSLDIPTKDEMTRTSPNGIKSNDAIHIILTYNE